MAFVSQLPFGSLEIAKAGSCDCGTITSGANLRSGWGLNQSCSPRWELSNGVLHATYTQGNWVDSQLPMVRSQIASLTPDLSFGHNLCCRCSNGSCKLILDIYNSISFQWYKERPNARCFDPCNQTLNFQESWRTFKSAFRECEFHAHTLKVGLSEIVSFCNP
jgi:hypothetical protein